MAIKDLQVEYDVMENAVKTRLFSAVGKMVVATMLQRKGNSLQTRSSDTLTQSERVVNELTPLVGEGESGIMPVMVHAQRHLKLFKRAPLE